MIRNVLYSLTAFLLTASLLTGCSSNSQPPRATTIPQPEATFTPVPEPSSAPTPEQEPGLEYDEIRTIAMNSACPAVPCQGYFTMSRDGLWGLMRADGTLVLPCKSSFPVFACGTEPHWRWEDSYNPADWESFYALSDQISVAGDGTLCTGEHGPQTISFFYALNAPGRDKYALDPGALRVYISGSPGSCEALADSYWEIYGESLPVYNGEILGGNADPTYPSEPQPDSNGTVYWYMNRNGTILPVGGIQKALWFFEEALAPVELEGGWAYIDHRGNTVTETAYQPTWCFDGENLPTYAACLQNGYAAVCREGQWGLLDSNGAEVIPCENEGVAWEGTHLWVKSRDGWHLTSLPR